MFKSEQYFDLSHFENNNEELANDFLRFWDNQGNVLTSEFKNTWTVSYVDAIATVRGAYVSRLLEVINIIDNNGEVLYGGEIRPHSEVLEYLSNASSYKSFIQLISNVIDVSRRNMFDDGTFNWFAIIKSLGGRS